MGEVTIRELRNHGGDVIDRVSAGERLIVTRSGRPVAELRPLPSRGVSATTLMERWRQLPPMDLDTLRADIDRHIDPKL